jgi:HAE1 family hydrophobic/amphiphilic exporter-1
VDELQLGPEAYQVQVGLAPGAKASRSDLEGLRLPLPEGGHVPLPAVARLEEGRGWGRIARVDGERTVTVRGDVDYRLGNASQILSAFRERFAPGLAERHPGVSVALAGEAADSAETQGSMASGMLMGLLGVFLLLSFQFKSYLEPLVVMTAIPLSLIGVIWGHWLYDFPFTLPSMLGFISLSGVVVNDSILLIEFVKMARREGMDVFAAAAQASRARFRAVLLTSSTTIAGLLPLLAETSLQAELIKGLVISVSFGLMASTVLVLFVVPCLFAILGDLGLVSQVEVDEP